MERSELEAFLARPWTEIRAAKDRYNAGRSPAELLEAADELHRHAWEMGARQTDEDRARDLAALVRLERKLERANKKRPRPR